MWFCWGSSGSAAEEGDALNTKSVQQAPQRDRPSSRHRETIKVEVAILLCASISWENKRRANQSIEKEFRIAWATCTGGVCSVTRVRPTTDLHMKYHRSKLLLCLLNRIVIKLADCWPLLVSLNNDKHGWKLSFIFLNRPPHTDSRGSQRPSFHFLTVLCKESNLKQRFPCPVSNVTPKTQDLTRSHCKESFSPQSHGNMLTALTRSLIMLVNIVDILGDDSSWQSVFKALIRWNFWVTHTFSFCFVFLSFSTT